MLNGWKCLQYYHCEIITSFNYLSIQLGKSESVHRDGTGDLQ